MPNRGGTTDRRRWGGRGAILLECILALAIFVVAGLSILAMSDSAMRSAEITRDKELAADLARSAMARIEAGIATPETLNGPVRDWSGESETNFAEGGSDSVQWILDVEAEPSVFDGLMHVSVRAVKLAAAGSDHESASFTLHQLVRLGGTTPRAAGGAP